MKLRAWIMPRGVNLMAMANVLSMDFKTQSIVVNFGDNPTTYEFNDGDYFLMQCTGVKDKNGHDIYQGDLLKIDLDHKSIVLPVTKMISGTWAVESKNYNKNIYDIRKKVEVIGNIYETPNLKGVELEND